MYVRKQRHTDPLKKKKRKRTKKKAENLNAVLNAKKIHFKNESTRLKQETIFHSCKYRLAI